MDNYKSNSHKSKDEQKRVNKVISGTAKIKKKNEIQKFASFFVPEDTANVKSYIMFDVVVPLIKKALTDTLHVILYPNGEGKQGNPTASKILYGKFFDEKEDRRMRDQYESRSRNIFDYDNIKFENRGDAEAVLDAMNDIINQFNIVSVGDLYDLANVSTDNYTVNKYGWYDISGCKPIQVRDGYILKLPRARLL